MKKFLIIGFAILILSAVFSPWTNVLAQTVTGGLVPCGTADEPCTLCHFIVGFYNLVDAMLKLLVVVTLAGITVAGVMYVISAGDETMMTSAKNFLKASLIGFAVVLGAFLIVNVTMWLLSAKDSNGDGKPDLGVGKTDWVTFSCSTESQSASSTSSQDEEKDTTPGEETKEEEITTCGTGGIGECKSDPLNCPTGWTVTNTDSNTMCPKGETNSMRCCVKNGVTTQPCQGVLSGTETTKAGVCVYGTTSCPNDTEWDLIIGEGCPSMTTLGRVTCCAKK